MRFSTYKIEYPTDHGGLLQELCPELLNGSSHVLYSVKEFGLGSIEFFQLVEGLSVEILKLKLHQSIEIIKTNDKELPMYELTFHTKGHGRMQLLSKRSIRNQPLNYGVTLVDSGVDTVSYFDKDDQVEHIKILFDKEWLQTHFPSVEKDWSVRNNFKSAIQSWNLPIGFVDLFEDILKEQHQMLYKKQFMRAKTLELLSQFLSWLQQSEKGSIEFFQQDVRKILQLENYIVNNLSANLSVAILAERVGFSESKLQKIFKSMYQESVHKRITRIRMKRAKKLIESRQYSISEVGFKMGYQNMSHFSSAFKKINQFLPSELLIH